MNVPFHPAIVHFPIALTFVLPLLIVVFALFIRANKMGPKAWFIVIGLQLVVVATGYVSLESGENEEEVVERVVAKKLISEHESAAEVFVGSAVLSLVLSIAAYFVRKEIGFPLKLAVAALTLLSSYLAYNTGHLGGELVYEHGAASAYAGEKAPEGLLPTPGLHTSESSNPVNESLKADENDYGSSDEIESSDDDDKQED